MICQVIALLVIIICLTIKIIDMKLNEFIEKFCKTDTEKYLTENFISTKEYSDKIKIPLEDLTGNRRKHQISISRQVYWYYLYSKGIRLYQICREFNNRRHSTVIYGIKRIKDFLFINDKSIKPYLDVLEIFSH